MLQVILGVIRCKNVFLIFKNLVPWKRQVSKGSLVATVKRGHPPNVAKRFGATMNAFIVPWALAKGHFSNIMNMAITCWEIGRSYKRDTCVSVTAIICRKFSCVIPLITLSCLYLYMAGILQYVTTVSPDLLRTSLYVEFNTWYLKRRADLFWIFSRRL